jgi:Xaa-Pro aminopeptidase
MTVNTSPYAQRLENLRKELTRQGVEGFLVPRADEFLGENVPPSAERLKWISGFTGSAGTAIILNDKAAVLSDGRYTIQLKQQVDASCFAVGDSVQTPVPVWLDENAKDKLIGFDPRLHTAAEVKKLEEKNIRLKPLAENPLDKVWEDRPAPPQVKVTIFPDAFAGQNAKDKIDTLAAQIKQDGAFAAIITQPDSIAWLLNIRGGDVAHTPVALSFAVLRADGTVQLFIDAAKISDEVRAHLGNRVQISAPEVLEEELRKLAQGSHALWLDEMRAPYWFTMVLEEAGAKLVNKKDPCIDPRARKNAAEQTAMKNAHIRDGVALVNFLSWLEGEAPKSALNELSVEKKLTEYRAAAKEYRDSSFDTIAGFGPNGAIVHYRATEKTALNITAPGLLLLDSGAQYEDGTTDITRTLAIGKPSDEMKYHYTLVLKGHIAVARAKFPNGTIGSQIDALARAPLWQVGLDYAHGTGHGVGCYLSVHEEAASISMRGKDALEVGMIISNEPGYYREGHYGIRIENLVLVEEEGMGADTGKPLLGFETITLCPYDTRLIDITLLDGAEKDWLKAYNRTVYDTLSPLVGEAERKWLQRHTDENFFD